MKQILVLVEGPTEDTFIKQVVNPYLHAHGRYLSSTIINTKIVKGGKNFKGGISNYGQVKRDLSKLTNSNTLPVTTFLDFYGLPNDFPGVLQKSNFRTSLERTLYIEQSLSSDIGATNLIPYIQLHEFEALLFTSISGFSYCFNDRLRLEKLQSIIDQYPNPEDINDDPTTAPSKRVLSIIPEYNKPFFGCMIALENTIDETISKCPHFASWIEKLIAC